MAIFILALCMLVASTTAQEFDMVGLINILYTKADSDMDLKVTRGELEGLFSTMDHNKNNKVEMSEFTSEWALLGMDDEISGAYFKMVDITGDGQVDHNDYGRLYLLADDNGDGIVSDQEFFKIMQKVYHGVAFVRLFAIADKASNNDQHLSKDEFSALFAPLTIQVDGSAALNDFQQAWTSSLMGTAQDAAKVFIYFDANKDGNLTKAEVAARFAGLDKSGNKQLELAEIKKLANIIPLLA